MGEFWEPWQPAIGQRVRVRLSGECPAERENEMPRHLIGHEPHVNGVTGIVTEPNECGCWNGHRFRVSFDVVQHSRRYPDLLFLSGSVYAALELEPLAE